MPNNQPQLGGEAAVRPTVGVIGLGAIGDGVATSLLRAGFPWWSATCDPRPRDTVRGAGHGGRLAGRARRAAPTSWWWPW